jgi:hypothetical protein
VEYVATPELRVTGLPRLVAPSLNWTVPVAALGETVAVNVTDWPNTEGLADELTVVVVGVSTTRVAAVVGLVMLLQPLLLLSAVVIVKLFVPPGVEPVVLTVKVVVLLVPVGFVLLTVAGLNAAVAPAGSPVVPIVVVQVVVVLLKVTVMTYVAFEP